MDEREKDEMDLDDISGLKLKRIYFKFGIQVLDRGMDIIFFVEVEVEAV